MAKRDSAASVVSPGLSTKKQFSPAGAKAATAFNRAKFGGKAADGSRGAYLEKYGKYTVQVLYPGGKLHLVQLSLQFTSSLFIIMGPSGK
jgi:hypothetical protein